MTCFVRYSRPLPEGVPGPKPAHIDIRLLKKSADDGLRGPRGDG